MCLYRLRMSLASLLLLFRSISISLYFVSVHSNCEFDFTTIERIAACFEAPVLLIIELSLFNFNSQVLLILI